MILPVALALMAARTVTMTAGSGTSRDDPPQLCTRRERRRTTAAASRWIRTIFTVQSPPNHHHADITACGFFVIAGATPKKQPTPTNPTTLQAPMALRRLASPASNLWISKPEVSVTAVAWWLSGCGRGFLVAW